MNAFAFPSLNGDNKGTVTLTSQLITASRANWRVSRMNAIVVSDLFRGLQTRGSRALDRVCQYSDEYANIPTADNEAICEHG